MHPIPEPVPILLGVRRNECMGSNPARRTGCPDRKRPGCRGNHMRLRNYPQAGSSWAGAALFARMAFSSSSNKHFPVSTHRPTSATKKHLFPRRKILNGVAEWSGSGRFLRLCSTSLRPRCCGKRQGYRGPGGRSRPGRPLQDSFPECHESVQDRYESRFRYGGC